MIVIFLFNCTDCISQFQKQTVITPYKDTERSYEMHFRPLFDWALDQLNHPHLISHFVWDTVKLSKFNGSQWIRFIHELWTGNNWWKTQVGQYSSYFHHYLLIYV